MQDLANGRTNTVLKKELKVILQHFKQKLALNKYYSDYFARSSPSCSRLCDEEGWFRCEGSYNENCCLRKHVINPYASRDMRILFSTWNLDHK